MTTKYKIYDSNGYEKNGSAKNFDEVFKKLEKSFIFKSFKILDANTNTDVTNEFKQYMYEKGFIFGKDG